MKFFKKTLWVWVLLVLFGSACKLKFVVPPFDPRFCSGPSYSIWDPNAQMLLQYPKENQVFQMDLEAFTGTIPFFGKWNPDLTGGVIPTGIEASWGEFSEWVLIDSAPDTESHTFRGVLPDQNALLGRQDIHIRFVNAPEIQISVPNVGVGIVIVYEGQSNMVQTMNELFGTTTGASTAWLYTDPWDPHAIRIANDPVQTCSNLGMVQGGSMNPEILDRISTAWGVPVMGIGASRSGANIFQFMAGDPDLGDPMRANLRTATADGASCPVLRQRLQGESEVRWYTQEEVEGFYLAYEDQIQDFYQNILGCPPVPVVLGIIGEMEENSDFTYEEVEVVRAAQRNLVGRRPTIKAGPETTLCPMTNGIHFNTDARRCLSDIFCSAIDAAGVNCE